VRHDWILTLLLATAMLAGCSLMQERPAPAPTSEVPSDASLVHGYLVLLDELVAATPARQAEIVDSAARAAATEPTRSNRLRYAFVLATPGHAASNDTAARAAFNELLTHEDPLQPGEHALANLMLREVDARIAMQTELVVSRNDSQRRDRDREALKAQARAAEAENERLRKQLADAEAKLDAIAELERNMVERQKPHGPR
jgi:hypothetical protein